MNNIQIIESKFVKIYKGHKCKIRSVSICGECIEMEKIGAFIKLSGKSYSSWEISEGIANACRATNNNYLLSVILLNFFFTAPLI
jgi:hypothetical protein